MELPGPRLASVFEAAHGRARRALCTRRGPGAAGAQSTAGGSAETLRLSEAEVYDVLSLLDVGCPASAVLPIGADAAARAGWARAALTLADREGRLVLKVLGRDILHKSDRGGVLPVRIRTTRTDPGEVQLLAAADDLTRRLAEGARADQSSPRPRSAPAAAVPAARDGAHGLGEPAPTGIQAPAEGLLACEFVAHRAGVPGHELLLSLKQDPALGAVILIGLGGVLTEWYGRATSGLSRIIVPAATLDPAELAETLRSHPALRLACAPSRLQQAPPFAAEQVAAAAAALAQLGATWGAGSPEAWTLEELEINPAVASEGRLVALDGVGLLSRRKWRPVRRPLGKITALLAPRSAAVLGVSARTSNPGRIILGNLRRAPSLPPGSLHVVHPHEQEIDGVPAVPAASALPGKVDLAVIAVPAEGAREAIRELVASDGAESIILIPGGFAEAGRTDLAAEIEKILDEGHARPGGGPVLVGGNCLGIVSRDRYNTFFLPPYKLPFNPGRGDNLALISQSGAYLVTFASNYDGIILPRASISYGNQMDLTVADFLGHFLAEPGVDVIGCYIEGFRPGDGERFLLQVRRARACGKRVIVFKAGKTDLGARAAASHTASLAGDYAVARASLLAAGAEVAESLDRFEDLVKTFTLLHGKPAGGRRTAIISNAGFECSTVTDQLGDLELAVLDAPAREALAAALPPYAHRDNPVDATPIADTEAYARSAEALLWSPRVDLAIVSTVPVTPALENLPRAADASHPEDLQGPASQAARLIPLLRASPKPAVLVVDSGALYDPLCRTCEEAGIPVFRKIDRAAWALQAFCREVDAKG
jgi:acyl-CoA synthetase (NDP forming)